VSRNRPYVSAFPGVPYDKGEDGRVYVYVDAEAEDEVQDNGTKDNIYRDAPVESLQDQDRFLREELAHKDAILRNMTQTMPQLTVPAEDGREDAPQSPASPGSSGSPSSGERRPSERLRAALVVVSHVWRLG
jgi:hypothetical protein